MKLTDRYRGLTHEEARARLAEYGPNAPGAPNKKHPLIAALKFLTEPVFLLLIGAALIYFLLGEPRDGAMMLFFVAFMSAINFYQEWKTDRTLEALKSLSSPKAAVIRGGAAVTVPSEELVPGDIILLSEGERVPADCEVLEAEGFGVNESALTGEPETVWKEKSLSAEKSGRRRAGRLYAGTGVVAGRAAARVIATGDATEYGKITKDVAEAPERPTPLEKQTRRLVLDCSFFSLVMLTLVIAATYARGGDFIESALAGITLAMATIPEEFPVVLTVFLALGAWRLAKRHALIRRVPSVETLGAVSVLCVDKTGTLTENRMTLSEFLPLMGCTERKLTETAVLASETNPYDPMERAILREAGRRKTDIKYLQSQRFLRDYPFSSESRMMAHVWEQNGRITAAAKGSPENILRLCAMPEEERRFAEAEQLRLSDAGCRVLAVAYNDDMGAIPEKMEDCRFELAGFAAFKDPPRENVPACIRACGKAGVRVVMITGDNPATAHRIAHEIGLGEETGREHVIITGEELDALDEESLAGRIKDVTIFSRVSPRGKMQIVRALRSRGEIVAMTGDGVNDAPALKYADIGIAMGGHGAEVAREAADMVLLDDDFSTIVNTIRDGRRIYDNIRKAMEYVIVIHIPIALSALAAPLLGLPPVLEPVHVMLLELIIDPTCSIIFERQPGEKDLMERPPRDAALPIINRRIFGKAMAQGLSIFAAAFGAYAALLPRAGAEEARGVFLTVVILANLFLVYVNRSDSDFAFGRGSAPDKTAIAVNAGILAVMAALSSVPPLSSATGLSAPSAGETAAAAALACVSTFWWEAVKWAKRKRKVRGLARS